MRNSLTLLFIFFICSCINSTEKRSFQNTNQPIQDSIKNDEKIDTNTTNLTFKEIEGSAVLIGDKIELLDQHLKPIKDISELSTEIIELRGISDSLFNKTEICNAFWYVKVNISGIEGIINGRQVFKISSSKRDTTLFINGKKIEILTTQSFGMGVEYQGDLMGCPVDQPVLIRDERTNFFGIIDVIQNDIYKKVYMGNYFPFFELQDDDQVGDRIDSIIPEDSNLRLKNSPNLPRRI